jgi:hypothetical protein
MLADGGEAISDLAVLRGQPDLFGPVASKATVWRLLNDLDDAALDNVRVARARARQVAWAQAAETGRTLSSSVAGYTIPGLVVDVDATIVVCHSEKGSAAKTWKRSLNSERRRVLVWTGRIGRGLCEAVRVLSDGVGFAGDLTGFGGVVARAPLRGTLVCDACEQLGLAG